MPNVIRSCVAIIRPLILDDRPRRYSREDDQDPDEVLPETLIGREQYPSLRDLLCGPDT